MILLSRVQIYQCILLYYLVQGLSLTEQEFREINDTKTTTDGNGYFYFKYELSNNEGSIVRIKSLILYIEFYSWKLSKLRTTLEELENSKIAHLGLFTKRISFIDTSLWS